MSMDAFVCNKCFTTTYRAKKPFLITQCGHIFCQRCIQQAEKQCPQCQQIGTISIPLQEPLLPKIANYFVSLDESLDSLQKVHTFQANQIKIMMQRFQEIDKKYENLKFQYCSVVRNIKELADKYHHVKAEKEKLEKKLMYVNTHGNSSGFGSAMTTPTNAFNSIRLGSQRSRTIANQGSVPVSSAHSTNDGILRTSEGFRIPSGRRLLRSSGSRTTSDASSSYTYKG